MPAYRIFRMKDGPRQQFRWAPHTSGVTQVKPKDYLEAETVDAASPYAAWFALKGSPAPLDVGDLLQSEGGELRIYKYVGFEEARWLVPEISAAGGPGAPPPASVPDGAGFPA